MEYIVDRFEEGFALLEPSEGPFRVEQAPRDRPPCETGGGDASGRGGERGGVDPPATAARRERLRRRFSAPKRPG